MIQIATTVSDGKYTIEQVVSIAKSYGYKVVVITDRDLMRWEYGLWPLAKIIKKTKEDKSITGYGLERYLNELSRVEKQNPGMVILAGAESAPYYHWRGSLLENNLTLENWHKHLLAIGLENPDDYINLPIIGNSKAIKFDQYGKDLGVIPYQNYINYVTSRRAMVF